jgi:hypothetical protein
MTYHSLVRMGDFLEAIVLLLPPEAGGRARPIAPREGSYRPLLRTSKDHVRVRFIEGPPTIEPGQAGRVVVELEASLGDVPPGSDLEIVEQDRVVGVLTVTRLWRRAVAV